MILLQLSAGTGPMECCRAVALACHAIEKQCKTTGVAVDIVEACDTGTQGCFKSVLLQLDSKDESAAKAIAKEWQGAMQWICQSQYRPGHKRKNWFFSGQMFEINEARMDAGVRFQACRASGAGGQHVNTTDSAIRATHLASGISVRVESERSQHANKRRAIALLFQKLESLKQQQMTQEEKQRWQQHWEVQRGNPVRTFKGEKFLPIK
ncbi:peptide chain release factor H [Shewanella submarina]|uniref:Peptide chain release factor H n=1 Tax=Shewanella submarina TaxID=2016376 RepID=A0ABV7G678_9GAMM|nr:peptide chain release factor H [Shewanella submarina]MCL1038503.1 peptide chain release factor H [Shewanella submarina]